MLWKVIVGACLQTVPRIEIDGARQVGQALLRMVGDAAPDRQAVKRIIGAGWSPTTLLNCSRASSKQPLFNCDTA